MFLGFVFPSILVEGPGEADLAMAIFGETDLARGDGVTVTLAMTRVRSRKCGL